MDRTSTKVCTLQERLEGSAKKQIPKIERKEEENEKNNGAYSDDACCLSIQFSFTGVGEGGTANGCDKFAIGIRNY
jgi:hypothetical protein